VNFSCDLQRSALEAPDDATSDLIRSASAGETGL